MSNSFKRKLHSGIFLLLFLALTIPGTKTYSQSVKNAGWFFLTNTHQLSGKFDLLTDIQIRTGDNWDSFNTLLLRGAISYNFTKKHSVALGYAYKGDWEDENGVRNYSPENRIYEQYLYALENRHIELNARFRLEQRFVEENGTTNFSQRGRAFVSAHFPLVVDSAFTKGLFIGVQDELFLNVHNKDKVNGNLFDQNRPYASLGYRFSKKMDAELGYMYWLQKEREGNSKTNVIQLMMTTKF